MLGDTPTRDYGDKLARFNRFAEPELRQLIAGLGLPPGARVLDAGCGAGLTTGWLAAAASPGGLVVGLDLSGAHVRLARAYAPAIGVAQGDIARPPFRAGAFDLVWCANTLHHLADPVAGLAALAGVLRPGGRLVLGQSAFLPDMFFAWDQRLETAVTDAVRRYYRAKYGLDERDTTAARNLVGVAGRAGLARVQARTVVIERVAPLAPGDEEYLLGVFRGYWDARLRPYLSADDWAELAALCDPESPTYCLRRPDFHHIQTFTTVTGERDD